MIRIPEGSAPDIKNKSFSMTASVEVPANGADGVLGTMGGRFGGWALLIMNGRPEFAYAFSNQPQHRYRVMSPQPLSPGKHNIRVDFKYDGGGLGKGGTATLSVDGAQLAQGRIEHTVRARFSLDESMDFGMDTGTPVLEEYLSQMPFKFTGKLNKFVIQLGEQRIGRRARRNLKALERSGASARE
jgi:arylsulfatase